MGLIGQGVLVLWWDIEPSADEDFNSWHLREHVPERVAVPGFIRGRRYVSFSEHPKYFTLYEAESVAVFGGGPYIERLNNPTPWTRRVLSTFRNTKRTACRVTVSLGHVDGGVIATLELAPRSDSSRLRAWLTRHALPTLLELPGVTAVHFFEPDDRSTRTDTMEHQIRHEPDQMAEWVILVEGTSAELVGGAIRSALSNEALARFGTELAAPHLYHLNFAMTRPA